MLQSKRVLGRASVQTLFTAAEAVGAQAVSMHEPPVPGAWKAHLGG